MPTNIKPSILHSLLTIAIALVWLINGLVCKVLNLVPRHQLIVARILGEENSVIFTRVIGLLEILMAVWIISGIKARFCTLSQLLIIASMNIIEFLLAPDLLLFGRGNILVATLLILVIAGNEFLRKDYRYAFKRIN